MAAVGKSKEADAAWCRRHPSHPRSAGVCPFCLRDRLSRLSAAASAHADSNASPSSASSPRSAGEESVASSAQLAPPCREARRTRPRLGLLMLQEEPEAAARGGGDHGQEEEEAAAPGEIKKAKRSNFWARLQQGTSWYRKDGCSLAHSKAVGEKSAAPKRGPLF